MCEKEGREFHPQQGFGIPMKPMAPESSMAPPDLLC